MAASTFDENLRGLRILGRLPERGAEDETEKRLANWLDKANCVVKGEPSSPGDLSTRWMDCPIGVSQWRSPGHDLGNKNLILVISEFDFCGKSIGSERVNATLDFVLISGCFKLSGWR